MKTTTVDQWNILDEPSLPFDAANKTRRILDHNRQVDTGLPTKDETSM